jgi:predicted MFS family arabinose efflux permease
MFVTALLAGRVAEAVGSRLPVILGSGLAFAALALLAWRRDQPWEVCVATGVLGIGFGLAYAAMSNLIVEAVPSDQTGVASGMNANIRTIGGSIGTQLMAGIVTARVAARALPPDSGYTRGFAFLALLLRWRRWPPRSSRGLSWSRRGRACGLTIPSWR